MRSKVPSKSVSLAAHLQSQAQLAATDKSTAEVISTLNCNIPPLKCVLLKYTLYQKLSLSTLQATVDALEAENKKLQKKVEKSKAVKGEFKEEVLQLFLKLLTAESKWMWWKKVNQCSSFICFTS